MELKLTGVAIASLEALLLDYEDFLRQRNLPRGDKNSPKALEVRGKYRSDQSDRYNFNTSSAEVATNTMICRLIIQAIYL